jgi:hypothetical protein
LVIPLKVQLDTSIDVRPEFKNPNLTLPQFEVSHEAAFTIVRLEVLAKALSKNVTIPIFQSDVFIAVKEVQPEKAWYREVLPCVKVSVAVHSILAHP